MSENFSQSLDKTLERLAQRIITRFTKYPHTQIFYFEDIKTYFFQKDQQIPIFTPLFSNTSFERELITFLTKEKFFHPEHNPQPIHSSVQITRGLIQEIFKIFFAFLNEENIIPHFIPNAILIDSISFNPSTLDLFTPSPLTPIPIATFNLLPSKEDTTTNPPQLFLNYLTSTLQEEEDPLLIPFIQEMMGYLLTPSSKGHAVFFLHGSGHNGKSVFLDILSAIFPTQTVSRATLESLTTSRFASSQLIGKCINIASEDDSKYLQTDLFKQLAAGEIIQGEYKHGATFTFTPKIKMIFSTNSYPSFESFDFAMRRRVFIVPFHRRIPLNERNPNLADEIITTELPQVIAWALHGLKRLIDRKFIFEKPPSVQRLEKEFEQGQSSVLEFFNENYSLTTNNEETNQPIKISFFYDTYKAWCLDVNRKAKPKVHFMRELYDRYPELESKRIKRLSDTQRYLTNVTKSPDKDAWVNSSSQAPLESLPNLNTPPSTKYDH